MVYRNIGKKVGVYAMPDRTAPRVGRLRKGQLITVIESVNHPSHGLCLRFEDGWVLVKSPKGNTSSGIQPMGDESKGNELQGF